MKIGGMVVNLHLFVKKWGWGKSNKQEIEDKRQHLMMGKEKN